MSKILNEVETPSVEYRKIVAVVEYDGTEYFGFQYQNNSRSIQGELENSLANFCQYEGRVVGAGRTDRGVHAVGQVISVRVLWKHSIDSFVRAWNANLPSDIIVRRAMAASEHFHPRYSALMRTYCYFVRNSVREKKQLRAPLTDRFSLFVPTLLDVNAMNFAGQLLLGEHDFASFGWPTIGDSTIRHIYSIQWDVANNQLFGILDSDERFLILRISGNGFLRQMVRNIVGTLLQVGRGNLDWQSVKDILLARNRKYCPPPASASGLLLESVTYPTEFELAFDG